MPRALISVYDKRGIIDFAKGLAELGWDIVSTGGTSKLLKEEGIKVIDISDITGFPECFDGRVKTLHPKIHGGILALKDSPEHIRTMKELEIESIDMVVNNLYPFKETILKEGATHEEIIENIDIGGPSMIRAAAKNYKQVTILVDFKDYSKILEELKKKGEVSFETKGYLAAKAFQHTSSYDALISDYFNSITEESFPKQITLTYEKVQDLRYGENPHQEAAFYRQIGGIEGTMANSSQLHGKELSFNNIGDSNNLLEILKEYSEPTVVAIKHGNPCGIGSGDTVEEAFVKAYEGDKVSIFGGIVGVNREVDEATAKRISDIFIEVIIAPSYSEKALEILKEKQNIRILSIDNIRKNDYKDKDIRKVLGGVLVQSRNNDLLKDELRVVTKRKPSEKELEDLIFAWRAVKHVKSNGIVIAKDRATISVGPGQVSRIWALENAIKQGGERVKESVMASDAFFPFSDCIIEAAKAGITAIIQPGGSIKDEESIKAADEAGIAMVFTGIRHFKH